MKRYILGVWMIVLRTAEAPDPQGGDGSGSSVDLASDRNLSPIPDDSLYVPPHPPAGTNGINLNSFGPEDFQLVPRFDRYDDGNYPKGGRREFQPIDTQRAARMFHGNKPPLKTSEAIASYFLRIVHMKSVLHSISNWNARLRYFQRQFAHVPHPEFQRAMEDLIEFCDNYDRHKIKLNMALKRSNEMEQMMKFIALVEERDELVAEMRRNREKSARLLRLRDSFGVEKEKDLNDLEREASEANIRADALERHIRIMNSNIRTTAISIQYLRNLLPLATMEQIRTQGNLLVDFVMELLEDFRTLDEEAHDNYDIVKEFVAENLTLYKSHISKKSIEKETAIKMAVALEKEKNATSMSNWPKTPRFRVQLLCPDSRVKTVKMVDPLATAAPSVGSEDTGSSHPPVPTTSTSDPVPVRSARLYTDIVFLEQCNVDEYIFVRQQPWPISAEFFTESWQREFFINLTNQEQLERELLWPRATFLSKEEQNFVRTSPTGIDTLSQTNRTTSGHETGTMADYVHAPEFVPRNVQEPRVTGYSVEHSGDQPRDSEAGKHDQAEGGMALQANPQLGPRRSSIKTRSRSTVRQSSTLPTMTGDSESAPVVSQDTVDLEFPTLPIRHSPDLQQLNQKDPSEEDARPSFAKTTQQVPKLSSSLPIKAQPEKPTDSSGSDEPTFPKQTHPDQLPLVEAQEIDVPAQQQEQRGVNIPKPPSFAQIAQHPSPQGAIPKRAKIFPPSHDTDPTKKKGSPRRDQKAQGRAIIAPEVPQVEQSSKSSRRRRRKQEAEADFDIETEPLLLEPNLGIAEEHKLDQATLPQGSAVEPEIVLPVASKPEHVTQKGKKAQQKSEMTKKQIEKARKKKEEEEMKFLEESISSLKIMTPLPRVQTSPVESSFAPYKGNIIEMWPFYDKHIFSPSEKIEVQNVNSYIRAIFDKINQIQFEFGIGSLLMQDILIESLLSKYELSYGSLPEYKALAEGRSKVKTRLSLYLNLNRPLDNARNAIEWSTSLLKYSIVIDNHDKKVDALNKLITQHNALIGSKNKADKYRASTLKKEIEKETEDVRSSLVALNICYKGALRLCKVWKVDGFSGLCNLISLVNQELCANITKLVEDGDNQRVGLTEALIQKFLEIIESSEPEVDDSGDSAVSKAIREAFIIPVEETVTLGDNLQSVVDMLEEIKQMSKNNTSFSVPDTEKSSGKNPKPEYSGAQIDKDELKHRIQQCKESKIEASECIDARKKSKNKSVKAVLHKLREEVEKITQHEKLLHECLKVWEEVELFVENGTKLTASATKLKEYEENIQKGNKETWKYSRGDRMTNEHRISLAALGIQRIQLFESAEDITSAVDHTTNEISTSLIMSVSGFLLTEMDSLLRTLGTTSWRGFEELTEKLLKKAREQAELYATSKDWDPKTEVAALISEIK